MSRRVVQIAHGLLRIEQDLQLSRPVVGTDASGPVCVIAHVRVARGSVVYLRGTVRITAPRSFTLILPPFTIVQASLDARAVKSIAVVFRPLASDPLPMQPVMFPSDADGVPDTRAVLLLLRTAGDATDVGRPVDPSPTAANTKAIIDAEYGMPLDIGAMARRLVVSPAALSRRFKQAYGVPPVRYRHHVRVMDALARLAAGEAPAEVFQDVGFDDLSRFYKIFRKVACGAPGAYRPLSRNAKT